MTHKCDDEIASLSYVSGKIYECDQTPALGVVNELPSSREFLSAYISGYADGEGCFSISIAPRATLAVGWEVRPSFSVSQNQDRAEVLNVLKASLRSFGR